MSDHSDTTHDYLRENAQRGEATLVLRCEACCETTTASDRRDALELTSGRRLVEGCPGEPDPVSPHRLAEMRPGTRVRLDPTTRSSQRGGVQVFEKATQPSVVGTVLEACGESVTILPTALCYDHPALSVQSGGPTEAFTVTAAELSPRPGLTLAHSPRLGPAGLSTSDTRTSRPSASSEAGGRCLSQVLRTQSGGGSSPEPRSPREPHCQPRRRRRPARKMMVSEITLDVLLTEEDAARVQTEITHSLNRHRHTEARLEQADTTLIRLRSHGRPDFRTLDYAVLDAFTDAGVHFRRYTHAAQLVDRR